MKKFLSLFLILFSLHSYSQLTVGNAITITSSGYVGVGTTTPSHTFTVNSTNTATTYPNIGAFKFQSDNQYSARGLSVYNGSSATNTGGFISFATTGSGASPTATGSGQVLGVYYAGGYDGTNWNTLGGMYLQTTEALTPTTNNTNLYFTTSTGASLRQTRMTILGNGNVGVANINPTYTFDVTGTVNATSAVMVNGTPVTTTTSTSTLTNKRIQPRVYSVASNTSLTPEIDTYDMFVETALAGALTINNQSTSTPATGEVMTFRIKDDGTARAINYGSYYRASTDLPLPTTTILGKTLYMQFIWNATDTKWDLIKYLDNF